MILIVGGAGYIGSHVNKELTKEGYKTVVLDNLSSGKKEMVKWGEFVKGNLGDEKILDEVFNKYDIEAVLHFAAFKAAGESVTDPQKYYLNNVGNTLILLKKMREYKINKFIFSSSAAVYGNPQYIPLDEKHPTIPLNPYGTTKLFVENILRDYDKAYGFKSVALRYFNAAGADLETESGELPGSSANLIPLVLDAAIGRREDVKVFGIDYPTRDGTCVRDYIHVSDLATAHIKALEYLNNGGESTQFNLGNGKGYSVKEVIDTAKKVTGVDFKVIEVGRREGDSTELLADSTKAKDVLGWTPQIPELEVIVSSAWKWNQKLGR